MAQRTVGRALSLARSLLTRRDRDSPSLSAQLLLAEVLSTRREELLLRRDAPLDVQQWRDFWRLVARRSQGEPVAYILGRKEFYGRMFAVNHAVLTPRPETEHLVEALLQRIEPKDAVRFADLGTGSGILAVTLALELPRSLGVGLDICPRALQVARGNAAVHDVLGRLLLVQGDFCNAPLPKNSLDILVANPPYVPAAQIPHLSLEVTRFEPRHALVPLQGEGASGLESIEQVLHAGACALRPGGQLVVELGSGQGAAVLELAGQRRYKGASILPDLAGHERVLLARRG